MTRQIRGAFLEKWPYFYGNIWKDNWLCRCGEDKSNGVMNHSRS